MVALPTVIVDAMGSDLAPHPEVTGALRAVRAWPLRVALVGDGARLAAVLTEVGASSRDAIEVVHASQVIAMTDHPAQAYRAKPDASMRVAVERLAAGQGVAVVSAGNSGAMVACALFGLGRLAGVERPAIVAVLPGPVVLCDAGANVEPTARQLAQCARIGAAYDRVVHERARPRVGLLSNGAEPGKGTALTREAHALLSEGHDGFDFVGYVEGTELVGGAVDVVATDGFTGNIVLKTLEGVLADQLSASDVGGALLAGVSQPAVIAHGRSDAAAIANAIHVAAGFAERDLPGALAAALSAR